MLVDNNENTGSPKIKNYKLDVQIDEKTGMIKVAAVNNTMGTIESDCTLELKDLPRKYKKFFAKYLLSL